MTTEEKAKAYDNGLEIARKNLEAIEFYGEGTSFAYDGVKNTLIHIFPELAESEDEKIRKELYESIRINNPIEVADKYIAYIEKQGEQKPVEWSEEDEKMLNQCAAAIHAADYYDLDDKNEMENWLKSIRPQKQWKPSEEQMEALNLAIGEANSVDTAAGDEVAEILISLYEQLKKLRG